MNDEPNTWFVMYVVQPETKRGFYEGTSLRMSHTPMAQAHYGMVRDDGQSAEEAVLTVVGTLEPEVRALVHEATVGHIREVEKILLD